MMLTLQVEPAVARALSSLLWTGDVFDDFIETIHREGFPEIDAEEAAEDFHRALELALDRAGDIPIVQDPLVQTTTT